MFTALSILSKAGRHMGHGQYSVRNDDGKIPISHDHSSGLSASADFQTSGVPTSFGTADHTLSKITYQLSYSTSTICLYYYFFDNTV
jgi:hypothetical protein